MCSAAEPSPLSITAMTNSFPRVLITDETLRDGFQVEQPGITVDDRLRVARLLVDAGIRRINVGAFVNPKWSPRMAQSADVVRGLPPRPGVEYVVTALNERGRQTARDMSPPLAAAGLPATHLHLCPVFLRRNTNRSVEQQEAGWRNAVDQATANGAEQAAIGLSAPWGSNFSGPVTQEARMQALQRQWEAWREAGIEVVRVELADPMSWNRPDAVAEDLAAIRRQFPTIREFHLHMHNGRGLALLSAWEALKALDADHLLMLDSALGGIGGCPYNGSGQATGMIATEDLVQLLELLGVPTGANLARLVEATHEVARLTQRTLDGRVHKAGPFLPLFDPRIPVVYTVEEAQHFRLGPQVCTSGFRPWEEGA